MPACSSSFVIQSLRLKQPPARGGVTFPGKDGELKRRKVNFWVLLVQTETGAVLRVRPPKRRAEPSLVSGTDKHFRGTLGDT